MTSDRLQRVVAIALGLLVVVGIGEVKFVRPVAHEAEALEVGLSNAHHGPDKQSTELSQAADTLELTSRLKRLSAHSAVATESTTMASLEESAQKNGVQIRAVSAASRGSEGEASEIRMVTLIGNFNRLGVMLVELSTSTVPCLATIREVSAGSSSGDIVVVVELELPSRPGNG